MATKRGPKSRKKRSAAKRAWFSMSKGTRKAIRRNYIKQTGSRKGLAAYKVRAGKDIRKARIARGTNPNTGTGSSALHALKRAAATGLISSTARKKASKTVRRSKAPADAAYIKVGSTRTSPAKYGKAVSGRSKKLRNARRNTNKANAAAGSSSRVKVHSGKPYTAKTLGGNKPTAKSKPVPPVIRTSGANPTGSRRL